MPSEIINRPLRHVLVFVLLDQDPYYFHQRGEWVRFVFANFDNHGIKQSDELMIISFRMWEAPLGFETSHIFD